MIILASKSPRREYLLKTILDDFLIIPANIEEDKYPIEKIAYHKAQKIASSFEDDFIISADTFIRYNQKIIGKPKDASDAYNILKELSGNDHEVITYYCIMNVKKNILYQGNVKTIVNMNELSDQLIRDYITSGSCFDKAGAYGIQDNEKFHLIRSIDGDFNNVLGFPVFEIKKALNLLGIKTK